jgi:hypothetical protein
MTIIFTSLFGHRVGKLKRAQEAPRLVKLSKLRFAVQISENRSLHVVEALRVYYSMPLFAASTHLPLPSLLPSLQNDSVIPS